MSARRRIAAATATTCAALGVGVGPAAADAPVSFDGACVFKSSSLRVDRGIGPTKAQHVNAALAGTGVCSGTLDGQGVSNTTSYLMGALTGDINCVDGTVGGPLSGPGRLQINGKTIGVHLAVTARSLRLQDHIELQGDTSGSAGGDGLINNTGSGLPTDAREGGIVGCFTDNMRQAVIDLNFRTATALVGDATAAAAVAAAKPRVVAPAQRRATVRRRGYVLARCLGTAGARCTVRVTRGRTVLARGRAATPTSVVKARLTRAGRRTVRRHRPLRVRVAGHVGTATPSRSIVLR